MEEKQKAGLNLSLPQILGGALASALSAVVGSRLGVAGTVLGAALASVVIGVGGALFTHGIHTTTSSVRQVVRRPRDAEPAASSTRPGRRAWGRAALAAVAMFVLAGLGITFYESAAGHSLSGGSGTTASSVTKAGGVTSARHTSTESDPSATGTRHRSTRPTAPSEDAGQPSTAPTSAPSESAPKPSTATSQAGTDASKTTEHSQPSGAGTTASGSTDSGSTSTQSADSSTQPGSDAAGTGVKNG